MSPPVQAAFIFTLLVCYFSSFISCDAKFHEHPVHLQVLDSGILSPNVSLDRSYSHVGRAHNTGRGPTILEYKLNNPKKRSLEKRVDVLGPFIKLPNCLQCEGKAQDQSSLKVDPDLMAEKLVSEMRYLATVGQCLFYGQRPVGLMPRSLSAAAKTWVCGFARLQYRILWQLWPDSLDAKSGVKDYYCLNPWNPQEGCWLNAIMPGNTEEERIPQAMLYFQQMSRAMALTCSGDVFILIDDPTTVDQARPGERWPSIWLTHELPVLKALYEKGMVSKLVAIELASQKKVDVTDILKKPNTVRSAQELDWNEPLARAVAAKKLEWLRRGLQANHTDEEASMLMKRIDNCDIPARDGLDGTTHDIFG